MADSLSELPRRAIEHQDASPRRELDATSSPASSPTPTSTRTFSSKPREDGTPKNTIRYRELAEDGEHVVGSL
jgi:hypothetical protein